MSIRPATHAGSWYTGDTTKLSAQFDQWFSLAQQTIGSANVLGARFLVGPHAGYSYLGPRLAETFSAWDPTGCKRLFILGPSHRVWFQGVALVSDYAFYNTPFGDVKVDTKTVDELVLSGVFDKMLAKVDNAEHLFEMHAPFVKYKHPNVMIVPIMILLMDEELCEEIVSQLQEYAADPENHFCVLTDFCHWGQSFDYVKYVVEEPSGPVENTKLVSLQLKPTGIPIYKLIEALDRRAMDIASEGDAEAWDNYIAKTGNTICGQKPMLVLLRLSKGGISWIGYSQLSQARTVFDTSVSYALGYAI